MSHHVVCDIIYTIQVLKEVTASVTAACNSHWCCNNILLLAFMIPVRLLSGVVTSALYGDHGSGKWDAENHNYSSCIGRLY